jgi:hypothetical protein
VWVRPRLTVATAVLFTAFIFLGLCCYFGALTNYVEGGMPTRAGLLLRDISYNGLLISMGMALFLGALGLTFLVAEVVIRRITANGERIITNDGPEV